MEGFILQAWERIQEEHKREGSNDFSPMQIEVFQESEKAEGLLEESFDATITYASGSRTHRSIKDVRKEQEESLHEQQELANRIYLSKNELEQKLSDAYDQGRAEAEKEEETKYQKQLERIEKSLVVFMQDLAAQEKNREVEVSNFSLDLSLQVAKKIIDGAVEINPEYILKVLKEALSLSGGANIKKIRVSAQDLEFIELFKIPQALKEFDGSWEFEADDTIKAGCILESSAGTIDYQLDKAWERIKDKILSLKKY